MLLAARVHSLKHQTGPLRTQITQRKWIQEGRDLLKQEAENIFAQLEVGAQYEGESVKVEHEWT